MCRRVFEYWYPCKHKRVCHVDPCSHGRKTTGRNYAGCSKATAERKALPSDGPCPECKDKEQHQAKLEEQRSADMQKHQSNKVQAKAAAQKLATLLEDTGVGPEEETVVLVEKDDQGSGGNDSEMEGSRVIVQD
ncbi:uncharacterized protein LTR77_005586 [Saxophila tyrrhenica]|uniref:Uncharacterized protein n=1 Tax=Saxophila tyrrhenica TaxID=1690608 RepID=A0AAV9PBW9_9PEZI|nr:hypothetical protein LTR77_005586 [Saxophila tyrrhenica]